MDQFDLLNQKLKSERHDVILATRAKKGETEAMSSKLKKILGTEVDLDNRRSFMDISEEEPKKRQGQVPLS